MDGLVRLVAIALGGPACTEEREERALEVELHQAGHGQHVRESMAGNMHEGRGPERRRRVLGRGHNPGRDRILDAHSIGDFDDSRHLCLHTR
jgi:hypothetical protein